MVKNLGIHRALSLVDMKLIEKLGVDTSDASMAYYVPSNVNITIKEDDLTFFFKTDDLYTLLPTGYNDASLKHFMYAYTVEDLLNKMKQFRPKLYFDGKLWNVSVDNDITAIVCASNSQLMALGKMYVDLIEKGHLK